MYEDKRRSLKVNWKSLLIKMTIFLVVVFLVMWLISIVTKQSKKNPSNIGENLKVMQQAAAEYFRGDKLPEKLNGKATLTLADMVDSKLIVEFKDQDGKACKKDESYAEVTKISDEEYTIKVKLVCNKENDYVINTVKIESQLVDNNQNDTDNNQDSNEDYGSSGMIEDNTLADNNQNDSTSNNNSSSNQNNGGSVTTQKPSTNKTPTTNKKPTITYVTTEKNNTGSNSSNNNTNTNTGNNSNNSSSNNSNNSSTNNNTNNNQNSSGNSNQNNNQNTGTVKPDDKPDEPTNSCIYGMKDYSTEYAVAYIIPTKDNCATNKDNYMDYSDKILSMAEAEQAKLEKEVSQVLKGKTYKIGVDYNGVFNKDRTGLVGYQIKFTVRLQQTYASLPIYAYYLNADGSRDVILTDPVYKF